MVLFPSPKVEPEEPLLDPEELLGIIPEDNSKDRKSPGLLLLKKNLKFDSNLICFFISAL